MATARISNESFMYSVKKYCMDNHNEEPIYPSRLSKGKFWVVEYYIVGWVNLYQKFEIEKYTVCGKLILPKKMERNKNKKIWAQLASEFAWICEYLQASCIQHF